MASSPYHVERADRSRGDWHGRATSMSALGAGATRVVCLTLAAWVGACATLDPAPVAEDGVVVDVVSRSQLPGDVDDACLAATTDVTGSVVIVQFGYGVRHRDRAFDVASGASWLPAQPVVVPNDSCTLLRVGS